MESSRLALERLQAITATLANAATPAEVAATVLERGMLALGAAAGAVGRLSSDGKSLVTIGVRGYPSGAVDPSQPYSLDAPSSLSEAIHTRRPTFLSNVGEWRERYPDAPALALAPNQPEAALAAAPLLVKDGVLGALAFRFAAPRDFGDGTGELILRLADQCAQALDRVLAYQEHRRAIEALERGNRRLDFLARASGALGSNSEPELVLDAVAKLAIGRVAHWCVIELFDPERPSVSVGHATSSLAADLRELVSLTPIGLGRLLAPGAAESGSTMVCDAAAVSAAFVGTRAAELVRSIGAGPVLIVPIMQADRWVGAVTLGGGPADAFGEPDIAVARDLSARIATALERAHLYGTIGRFKTTVDASLDAVYMFDPASLVLTYVNHGAVVQAGAQATELVGLSVLELQRQFSGPDLRARLRPLLAGDVASIGYTGMLSRTDGGKTPIDAHMQCVRLPDGTVTVVLTARDLTEQIEVQARLARVATAERRRAAELDAILEAMREGLLVVDGNGVVLLANAAAREICGNSPETLAQLAASLAIDEEALPLFHTSMEERTIELPDGRWIEVSAYPTEGTASPDVAEPGTSIVVLRDVTLSREAAQAQEAFMGVLSHELRTPVTSIYGYAKVLQRPGPRERSAEMLSDIEAEADRLYRIVEDLLALSRVQAGFTVEGEPLLLQHLVKPLVVAEALRWPQITVELKLPADLPTVFGERTYVEQVLRNMISNAAKYSARGTNVTITGRAIAGEVEMRVEDRGVGITPGEADQLFRLFYRSPNTARQASGAGIGLYVCRGLVQAMGGRIWALARAGGGSEFGFSLPVLEAEPDEEEPI